MAFTSYLSSISVLQSNSTAGLNVVNLQGYSSPGDGGQGTFAYVPSDTTSADNGGTIIVDAIGERFYRDTNGYINVLDFGAPATTTTVANAISAIGGGTLHFPNGSYSVTLPSNYVGTVLEYEGPNTPYSFFQESGETTRLAGKLFRAQSGAHPTTDYAAVAIEFRPSGSTNESNGFGDIGLRVSSWKQGYPSSTVTGQVSGIEVFASNCAGDVAALDLNTNITGGFGALIEGVVTQLSTSSVPEASIDCQLGVLDPRDGIQAGLVLSALLGTLGAGIIVQAPAPAPGAATWLDFIQFNVGVLTPFRVDGLGQIWLEPFAGTGSPALAIRNNSGSFSMINDGGAAEVFTISQIGSVFAAGSIQAATLLITNVATLSATAGAAALPSNPAGFLDWANGGTTIKIPYYNN